MALSGRKNINYRPSERNESEDDELPPQSRNLVVNLPDNMTQHDTKDASQTMLANQIP
jgi:hypothetical protein